MTIVAVHERMPEGNSLDGIRPLFAEEMRLVNDVIRKMTASEVPLVSKMAEYIIASGGKRLRPILTILSAKLCGYNGGLRHVNLAASIEFIHTATLLHDDVVDESNLRRGERTANDVWGNAPSVLVGDFLLSRAFQIMARDKSPRVLEVLSDAAATITQGEVNQLITKNDITVTQEAYIEIISAKTAALFAAACEIGAVLTERSMEEQQALSSFGENLGIAFQIADDALDYSSAQEKLGKNIGDDFHEGKVTLPVILAFGDASGEEKSFWQRTMADQQQSPEDLAQAISYINNSDVLSRTMEVAELYAKNARRILEPFSDCPERDALFILLDFAISRPY